MTAKAEAFDYRPAKLVPVSSPAELRERTVRDYRRNAERAGIDVSSSALECLAVHDCEMVDAYNRGIDLSPNRTKPARQVKQAPPPADDGLKYKAVAAPEERDRPRLLYTPAHKVSVRWSHAMARLRRITAGASQNPNPRAALATCECPDLAFKALRVLHDYRTRHRTWRQNPYQDLSEQDCERVLMRLIENICDESTGRMGPWLVPK